MFRIKICGVTTPDDALLAAKAGADAIGVNFYAESPRYVTPEQASVVLSALPPGVARVGIFVNASAAEIVAVTDQLSLDWIQLHGDEPPELIAQLAPRRVLRAIRAGADGIAAARQALQRAEAAGQLPAAVLADAAVHGAYGGTGQTVDWKSLAPPRDWLDDLPLVVSGGLTPDNVATAIAQVRPDAVDTASGVESSPGRKDAGRVRQFVAAAREAFVAIDKLTS